MSKFDDWWASQDNPALKMPESTAHQMKFFLKDAFKAGQDAERGKKVKRIDL